MCWANHIYTLYIIHTMILMILCIIICMHVYSVYHGSCVCYIAKANQPVPTRITQNQHHDEKRINPPVKSWRWWCRGWSHARWGGRLGLGCPLHQLIGGHSVSKPWHGGDGNRCPRVGVNSSLDWTWQTDNKTWVESSPCSYLRHGQYWCPMKLIILEIIAQVPFHAYSGIFKFNSPGCPRSSPLQRGSGHIRHGCY